MSKFLKSKVYEVSDESSSQEDQDEKEEGKGAHEDLLMFEDDTQSAELGRDGVEGKVE